MADIFISYAKENRDAIRPMVQLLVNKGWSVWWDPDMIPGWHYADVLQQEIITANCIIVAWTKESIKSEWVWNEAQEGKNRNVLLPVLFEKVEPPLGFRHMHVAKLIDWHGEENHNEVQQLLKAVKGLCDHSSELKPGVPEISHIATPESMAPLEDEHPEKVSKSALSIFNKGTVILVVDDNENNRYTLTERLKREGYDSIEVAENGRQALDLLRSKNFDLVLLDIMMPELDGFEVLQQMKAHDTLRHIPVIMISSLDEMDNVVKCINLGAEDYLPKPFNPVLLKARIGACLEKKRLHDLETEYLMKIEQEKKRSDDLLHVIFPHPIIQELKSSGTVQSRRFENVAVLFNDIVDFTSYCDNHDPEEVMSCLQVLVEAFEGIAAKRNLEKIKTIDETFMATVGLLTPIDNPVLACIECGFDMVKATQNLVPHWQTRVGIHIGPVLAGVVGRQKYSFDLWGETVNTAAHVVKHAPANEVVLSDTAWLSVRGHCQCESLGRMKMKGKGEIDIYHCTGLI